MSLKDLDLLLLEVISLHTYKVCLQQEGIKPGGEQQKRKIDPDSILVSSIPMPSPGGSQSCLARWQCLQL